MNPNRYTIFRRTTLIFTFLLLSNLSFSNTSTSYSEKENHIIALAQHEHESNETTQVVEDASTHETVTAGDEAHHIEGHEGEHGAEHEGGHHADFSPLLFIIISLLIGAATRHWLARVNIPFTVALLIIGMGLGILGRINFFEHIQLFGNTYSIDILDNGIDWASKIDAHLMLTIFLPILIFEAAFAMDVHTFKKSFVNSVLLAVPGILVAIFTTAIMIWFLVINDVGLGGWSFMMVVLFGAVISATDPVAVVSILKELGASKKLGTLIEGESLLNDGTAIVIFNVLIIVAAGGAMESSPIVDFFVVSGGGVLIGLIIGWIGLYWIKRVFNDMLVEITIIVSLAYATFFICEQGFAVSGVLGLVTLGLMFAGPGRTRISANVQHFIHEFWEFAAFAANTLIFLIVGVVIAERTKFDTSDFIMLFAVYAIIHIARIIVIVMLMPFMKRAGYGIGKNHPQAMWWGALRGAIGLALALIVESNKDIPEEVRNQFLFLTAGIVTLTLLVNATTMKAVAKKLGLTALSKEKRYVMATATDFVHTNTISEMDGMRKDRFFKKVNWDSVTPYLPPKAIEEDLEAIDNFKEESRRRLLEREKSAYWSQFKNGLISSSAYELLVSEINEIIDSQGKRRLSDRGDLDILLSTKNAYRRLGPLASLFANRSINRLGASFDAAKGFYNAQLELATMLKDMRETANEEEIQILEDMDLEIEENKIQALTFLRNFRNQFPNIYRHVSTRQAIRTLLNLELKNVNNLHHSGRITGDEATAMIIEIESRMKRLGKEKMTKEERSREKAKVKDDVE